MDPLVIVLTVVISLFSLILGIAGIQLILVLQELKKTLKKINSAADTIEKVAVSSISPLANLGGTIEGVKGGLKVAQAFVGWLHREGK